MDIGGRIGSMTEGSAVLSHQLREHGHGLTLIEGGAARTTSQMSRGMLQRWDINRKHSRSSSFCKATCGAWSHQKADIAGGIYQDPIPPPALTTLPFSAKYQSIPPVAQHPPKMSPRPCFCVMPARPVRLHRREPKCRLPRAVVLEIGHGRGWCL